MILKSPEICYTVYTLQRGLANYFEQLGIKQTRRMDDLRTQTL